MKCFYRKKSHNRAFCDNRPQQFKQLDICPYQKGKSKSDHEAAIINTISEKEREVLLLCKEIIVFNTENSECYEEVLFDIGKKLSFVSRELVNRLELEEILYINVSTF